MILNGWKEIMAYCKVKDIKTIKKRVKILKMPVVKLFGRPHSTTELLDLWFVELDKYLKSK